MENKSRAQEGKNTRNVTGKLCWLSDTRKKKEGFALAGLDFGVGEKKENVLKTPNLSQDNHVPEIVNLKQVAVGMLADESCHLRKDVGELGWSSFQQRFDSRRNLCLYATYPGSTLIELSFFHMEGVAAIFGVGTPFAIVKLDSSKKDFVTEEEILESTWTALWVGNAHERFSPIIFEEDQTISTVLHKLSIRQMSGSTTPPTKTEEGGSSEKNGASNVAATLSKCTRESHQEEISQEVRAPTVEVKKTSDEENEEQRFLILHIKMSEQHSKFYNGDGREKTCRDDPVLKSFFIKPHMIMEFFCEPVANLEEEYVNMVNVTLNVDYQFIGDIQDQGRFGWYQSQLRVSFACEDSDAAILEDRQVLSELIKVEVDSTATKEDLAVQSSGMAGSVEAKGGFEPFVQLGVTASSTKDYSHSTNEAGVISEKTQRNCLQEAPEFTVSDICIGNRMAYQLKVRSHCSPHLAPDKMWNSQFRHDFSTTGMFCTLRFCARGTWQLDGKDNKYHQFRAEKELRQYIQMRDNLTLSG